MAFDGHERNDLLPFCIMEHTEGAGFTRDRQPSGLHWDWLFAIDHDGPLKTWSSPPLLTQSPFTGADLVGKKTPVRSLPDHRRRYLEYDGPLSQSRGHVRGLLRGLASCCEWSMHQFHLIAFPRGEPDGISIRVFRDDQGSESSADSLLDTDGSNWTLTVEAFKADALTPANDAI